MLVLYCLLCIVFESRRSLIKLELRNLIKNFWRCRIHVKSSKLHVPGNKALQIVNGEVKHFASPMNHSSEDSNRSFGDMYFIDPVDANERRLSNEFGKGCDPDLLKQLDSILR